ncbi:MAG: hypothetical protein ACI9W2_004097 [Gammaproteobacteria bacterium]|jgi:hypothetical protein
MTELRVLGEGPIEKMVASLGEPIEYHLPMGDQQIAINPLVGKAIALEFLGKISCVHCARTTKKSFNQGYCYPCFSRLAQCDSCIVKPELCHYAEGTCREPTWGERNCMIPHTVYLANSSGLKVGITRGEDPTTRWIDQGAAQGLAIRTVPNRLAAGNLEVALKPFVADKTNWRKMLKGEPQELALDHERDRLVTLLREGSPEFELPGHQPDPAPAANLQYPVREFPEKVASHNLDKKPELKGQLNGIKGQYLILDTAVINLRKYGGYHLRLSAA